jgi:hypothetical protein
MSVSSDVRGQMEIGVRSAAKKCTGKISSLFVIGKPVIQIIVD